MKKKIASAILAVCLLCGMLTLPAGAAFTDISDQDTAVAAAALQSMGIVEGTTSTTYSPARNLTRAQFCALTVRAMGLEDSVKTYAYKALFTDVKPGAWYTGYINLACSKGIINGYGNGKFGPNNSVSYGQAVAILLRLLGYSSSDVGRVWPTDYVSFADELEINEHVALDAYDTVSRANAAKLLYNTIKTEPKGASAPYYKTISGVASAETAIVLDNNASASGGSGYLMACVVGSAEASIEYIPQKKTVSADLTGFLGTLLLNSAGKAVGFVPDGTNSTEFTIKSAKTSGITDTAGVTHRITGSAMVISGDKIDSYHDTGYLQVNAQAGRNARLFYDDNGAVRYVYVASGTASSATEAVVAMTNSAASELTRKLGIDECSITKDGAPAGSGDLARYDVAYYDSAARTMCVSDYRITGCIESASPSVDAADTITVAGCRLNVLESAWDTLSHYDLGSAVTLLLTDDGKVAAAVSDAPSDQYGILSTDGQSVTLCGSGLVLTPDDLSAPENLYGALVKVSAGKGSKVTCSAVSGSGGRVSISGNTVDTYGIAPGCDIYEWAGSNAAHSYVYSLSGEPGTASDDFSALTWTDSLPASYVSYYHRNAAGKVDLLLLNDATGNCYQYGEMRTYTGSDGINLNPMGDPSYNNAATVTNSSSESAKYLCTLSQSYEYAGLAVGAYSASLKRVTAVSRLTSLSGSTGDAFFQNGDDWYVTASAYEIPVSDTVEVYVASSGKWYRGKDGILTAISSGMKLKLLYDRTLSTGAQIRLILVQSK
jgi:hypothetical protein